MNRWTGIGRLTKEPTLLDTNGHTSTCAMRMTVKLAGIDGRDGHFDVIWHDDSARMCADYVKIGREVAIDGRLVFEETRGEDGSYRARVYILAEGVEFLGVRSGGTYERKY